MLARAALAGLLVATFASCNGARLTGTARALPQPTSSYEEIVLGKAGTFLLHPVSAPVESGVEYEMDIHTHCGLDAAVIDFDSSFWDFAGPGPADDGSDNPPKGFDNPNDHGTITLLTENEAKYISGQGVGIDLMRHDGPKRFSGCA